MAYLAIFHTPLALFNQQNPQSLHNAIMICQLYIIVHQAYSHVQIYIHVSSKVIFENLYLQN